MADRKQYEDMDIPVFDDQDNFQVPTEYYDEYIQEDNTTKAPAIVETKTAAPKDINCYHKKDYKKVVINMKKTDILSIETEEVIDRLLGSSIMSDEDYEIIAKLISIEHTMQTQKIVIDIRNKYFYPKEVFISSKKNLKTEVLEVVKFLREQYVLKKNAFTDSEVMFLKSFKNSKNLNTLPERTIIKLWELKAAVIAGPIKN